MSLKYFFSFKKRTDILAENNKQIITELTQAFLKTLAIQNIQC